MGRWLITAAAAGGLRSAAGAGHFCSPLPACTRRRPLPQLPPCSPLHVLRQVTAACKLVVESKSVLPRLPGVAHQQRQPPLPALPQQRAQLGVFARLCLQAAEGPRPREDARCQQLDAVIAGCGTWASSRLNVVL